MCYLAVDTFMGQGWGVSLQKEGRGLSRIWGQIVCDLEAVKLKL